MALEDLFGSWKLVSHQFIAMETNERRDMFGTDPLGTLIITRDNQMMVLITSNNRKVTQGEANGADLFKSMLAYSGPIRIEGADQFITTVEVSWHPGWVGTEQARKISFDGGILTLSTPPMMHPMFPDQTACSVLKWERISTL